MLLGKTMGLETTSSLVDVLEGFAFDTFADCVITCLCSTIFVEVVAVAAVVECVNGTGVDDI